VAKKRRPSNDDDLIELMGEYSSRRTYRPVEEGPEPGQVPAGPSGTAMSADKPAARDPEQDQERTL
jgi:hypothetical protein